MTDPGGDLNPEEFAKPDQRTIGDLAAFTGLPETSLIKSLVYVAGERPVLLLLRGDHSLSEPKLLAAVGASSARPAEAREIRARFGADPGSLGPVGVRDIPVLCDLALERRRNMVAGANRNGHHLRHVTPGKDFTAAFHDLRQATAGDTELATGAPLEFIRASVLGRGTPARLSSEVKISTERGEEAPAAIGSCTLDLERILRSAAELYADKDGLALPASLAPFDVVVTPVNIGDEAQRVAAEALFAACEAAGLDVILDDRDERPGVKFKDNDLTGIPYRITVGKKLAQGIVEAYERSTKQVTDLPCAAAAAWVQSRVNGTA